MAQRNLSEHDRQLQLLSEELKQAAQRSVLAPQFAKTLSIWQQWLADRYEPAVQTGRPPARDDLYRQTVREIAALAHLMWINSPAIRHACGTKERFAALLFYCFTEAHDPGTFPAHLKPSVPYRLLPDNPIELHEDGSFAGGPNTTVAHLMQVASFRKSQQARPGGRPARSGARFATPDDFVRALATVLAKLRPGFDASAPFMARQMGFTNERQFQRWVKEVDPVRYPNWPSLRDAILRGDLPAK